MGEPKDMELQRDAVISAPARTSAVQVESLEFESGHGLLKDCAGRYGWKNAGNPCRDPEWTPRIHVPVSHTMATRVKVRVRLAENVAAVQAIHGTGPLGMTFQAPSLALSRGSSEIELTSDRQLERKIQRLEFPVRWSQPGESQFVVPSTTSNTIYVTMGQPMVDQQGRWREDGVTRKRMDRAVAWVEPLDTLDPHAIVAALMARFPYYSLHPSAKVPRHFKHPTFFNDEGGAWAMTDYVEESGECQAIVRLVRGILRQLGVPGVTEIMVTWADPEVNGGATPIHANLEETPNAGLTRAGKINGKRVLAALIDGPVEEGQTYPASHTPMSGGKVSPGLNRYEACLKFTAGGKTRYYCGGAGVVDSEQKILAMFWGLVWFTPLPDNSYRIEKILQKY